MSDRSRLFHRIVRALVPAEPELDADVRDDVEAAVVDFLAAQIGSLPPFLRIPYRVALVGFDWLAVARYGTRYVDLDELRGRSYLRAWDRSPLGLCRDFVRLLRSCALLAYLDHPAVTRQLEIDAGIEAAR